MTRIYIDGRQVTDDEIDRYEITDEEVKRIFIQAVKRKKEKAAG